MELSQSLVRKFSFHLEGYHIEAPEDASGEVVAVGDDVTDFKVGDRVTPIIFQGHHQASRDLFEME